MTREYVLNKTWRPLQSQAVQDRIESILRSWKGTPYMALQCCKQGGVDCIRFVCAVSDELYGYTRGPVISLPPDQSMHDREGAMLAMRAIKRRYDPVINVAAEEFIEPGDLIVTGPMGGGPGHAMFVGTKPGHIWETAIDGVRQSGMPTFGTDSQLFRIYRVLDKETAWLSK